jgi:hypothetical protein
MAGEFVARPCDDADECSSCDKSKRASLSDSPALGFSLCTWIAIASERSVAAADISRAAVLLAESGSLAALAKEPAISESAKQTRPTSSTSFRCDSLPIFPSGARIWAKKRSMLVSLAAASLNRPGDLAFQHFRSSDPNLEEMIVPRAAFSEMNTLSPPINLFSAIRDDGASEPRKQAALWSNF